MLASDQATSEAKLFAAVTLKGKVCVFLTFVILSITSLRKQIIYDLHQLDRQSLSPLRDSLLALLLKFSDGPRPIRTQLCVSLANLAIQMLEWKDVLPAVGTALGNSASDCILEFLRVLPEEVTEGRKINLSVRGVKTPLAFGQAFGALYTGSMESNHHQYY